MLLTKCCVSRNNFLLVFLQSNSPVAVVNSEAVKTTALMHEPEVAQLTTVNNQGEHAEGDAMEPHHTVLQSVSDTASNDTNGAEESEPALTNDDRSEGLEDPSDQSGAIISGLSSIAESFDEFLAKARSVIPKVHYTIFDQNSDSVFNDSWPHLMNKTSKRDTLLHRMSAVRHKSKGGLTKVDLHTQTDLEKNTNQSWEHLEATKAIFELLKEISGLSFLFFTLLPLND